MISIWIVILIWIGTTCAMFMGRTWRQVCVKAEGWRCCNPHSDGLSITVNAHKSFRVRSPPGMEINALVPIWPIGVSKWNFDIKRTNRWIHIGSCIFRQFVMLNRLCQNCVLTLHALTSDKFGTRPPRFMFKHCIFTVNEHASFSMVHPHPWKWHILFFT